MGPQERTIRNAVKTLEVQAKTLRKPVNPEPIRKGLFRSIDREAEALGRAYRANPTLAQPLIDALRARIPAAPVDFALVFNAAEQNRLIRLGITDAMLEVLQSPNATEFVNPAGTLIDFGIIANGELPAGTNALDLAPADVRTHLGNFGTRISAMTVDRGKSFAHTQAFFADPPSGSILQLDYNEQGDLLAPQLHVVGAPTAAALPHNPAVYSVYFNRALTQCIEPHFPLAMYTGRVGALGATGPAIGGGRPVMGAGGAWIP